MSILPAVFRTSRAGRAALCCMMTLLVVYTAAFSLPVMTASAAGAKVRVTVEGGTMKSDGNTTLDLKGTGFQSIKGGFGGIYVLFGWVSDPQGTSWRPSQGGVTGTNYRYVSDDESNPVGYELFVAFPGSSTESAANGGTLDADGTWNAKLTVPGQRFTSKDRQGNPTAVDCSTSGCGIITIGAHGVVNSSNETFTPVSFAAAASSTASPTSQSSASASGSASSVPSTTASTDAADASQTANGNAGADGDASDTGNADASADEAALLAALAAQSQGSSWTQRLISIALVLLGVSAILLAAGVGGYLAAKSLLLGVSPSALEKEIARRQRRAQSVRTKQEVKTMRTRRRGYRKLAKEQARASDASVDIRSEETMGYPGVLPASAGPVSSPFFAQRQARGDVPGGMAADGQDHARSSGGGSDGDSLQHTQIITPVIADQMTGTTTRGLFDEGNETLQEEGR